MEFTLVIPGFQWPEGDWIALSLRLGETARSLFPGLSLRKKKRLWYILAGIFGILHCSGMGPASATKRIFEEPAGWLRLNGSALIDRCRCQNTGRDASEGLKSSTLRSPRSDS